MKFGSCWSITTATLREAEAELYNPPTHFPNTAHHKEKLLSKKVLFL
jgi:hypothetical protein